jgi:hypothetical protein
MPLCANHCGTDYSENYGWYIVHDDDCPGPPACEDGDCVGHEYHGGCCSISCLIELGWKIREKQPKLSKSRSS